MWLQGCFNPQEAALLSKNFVSVGQKSWQNYIALRQTMDAILYAIFENALCDTHLQDKFFIGGFFPLDVGEVAYNYSYWLHGLISYPFKLHLKPQ